MTAAVWPVNSLSHTGCSETQRRESQLSVAVAVGQLLFHRGSIPGHGGTNVRTVAQGLCRTPTDPSDPHITSRLVTLPSAIDEH